MITCAHVQYYSLRAYSRRRRRRRRKNRRANCRYSYLSVRKKFTLRLQSIRRRGQWHTMHWQESRPSAPRRMEARARGEEGRRGETAWKRTMSELAQYEENDAGNVEIQSEK